MLTENVTDLPVGSHTLTELPPFLTQPPQQPSTRTVRWAKAKGDFYYKSTNKENHPTTPFQHLFCELVVGLRFALPRLRAD